MTLEHDPKEMTFLEHLEELRRVIIDGVLALVAALAVSWFLAMPAQNFLVRHAIPEDVSVVVITVLEAFSARLKVALALSLILVLPFIAWRIWKFVVPGLKHGERRAVLPVSAASSVLFYLGTAFGFMFLTPLVVRMMLAFAPAAIEPTISVNSLLDFVLKLCLASGLVFQMPLVFCVLTYMGVVSPEWLLARWRYAVLVIFIAAALATPGDGPTQLVVGIPITGLYFVSIGLAKLVEKRRPDSTEDLDGDPPTTETSQSAASEPTPKAAPPDGAVPHEKPSPDADNQSEEP